MDARRTSHAVVAFATIVLCTALVVPQLLSRSDAVGDAPGHVAVAAYLRDHLLPWTSGFNPQFFCGFEQGQFYPPLFHLAVASLGKLCAIETAYRLVVAFAVACLPFVLFRSGRRLGLTPPRAAVAMLGGLAVLATTPYLGGAGRATGATFHSTYVVGLGANAFALVLWLPFIAILPRALVRSGSSGLSAALLGGLVIAAHFVCGVNAALYGIVAVVVALGAARRSRWRDILRRAGWIAAGVFGVSAFFVVPFLLDRGASAVRSIDAGEGWLTPLVAAAAFVSLLLRTRIARRVSRGAWATGIFAAVVAAMLPLADWAEVGAHLDRFHLFVQLCAIFALAGSVPRGLVVGIAGATAAAIAIALAAASREQFPSPPVPPALSLPRLEPTSRVLVVGHPNHTPGRHWLHNVVPRQTGAAAAIGLFVESSPVARTLFDVAAVIEPDVVRWGVPGDEVESDAIRGVLRRDERERGRWLAWALAAFGIDHVLTEHALPTGLAAAEPRSVCDVVGAGRTLARFSLHRLTPTALVAPLPEGIVAMRSASSPDFEFATHRWLGGGGTQPLPIVAEHDPSASTGAASNIELEAIDLVAPRLRFVVDGGSPVPVLIKIGWHPRLRARTRDGEIPVHRAGNGLCVVIAHGEVTIESRGRRLAHAANIVSGIVCLALLGALWRIRYGISRPASRFRR